MFKKAKKNKKGFTLAELLIVVAIIAVLVAISIPIFTSQLEKSRDAVSISNIRAAYAEAQSAYLTTSSDTANGVEYTAGENNTATVVVKKVAIKSQNSSDNWSGESAELPFKKADGSTITITDPGKAGNYDITFSYDANGAFTNIAMTPSSSN